MKLIHISALGLENAKDSKYANSKISGEKFIRSIMPDATIIKPSLVYSVDDNLTTKFKIKVGIQTKFNTKIRV